MLKNSLTKVFSTLQKVGQALMVPVSVLPAAGLIVALGRLLQKYGETASGTASHSFIHNLGEILFHGGLSIFEQLPVIFAIGVAIGFTGGAGVAGLAAVVGYFTLTSVLKVMGTVTGVKLAIDTGVFGGILIGLVTAQLYHRYFKTKLHPVLGFFSGKRLVPIMTVAAAIVVGLLLGVLWPPVQAQINRFGIYVMGSEFGPAFYAAGKRLLIPLGLHHVYYPPFLYEFGEFVTSSGQVLRGESPRYFGGDPTAGRFMAAEFPLMLFGLPAAAYAMYLRAKPEMRKGVFGVMLSAALTSILTGITEPIEFSFIFVAPILYIFHVGAAFLSGYLTGLFDIHLGYTFSASAIDYVLGIFNQKNSFYLFAVVGPVIAALYFAAFYSLIGLFDLKTPGRDEGEEKARPELLSSEKAAQVLEALGGATNLLHLEACITRLRLVVRDPSKVNEPRLKELGASGVLNAGGGNLQIVFGVESDLLKDEISNLISTNSTKTEGPSHPILSSPLTGKLLPLSEVPDETFSSKILGDGFAIEPTDDILYSPIEGTVTTLFRTKHALSITTDQGLEVLLHIGVDTVKMEGRGFNSFIATGDRVKVGTKLIQFDKALISTQAKSNITPVTITNMDLVERLEFWNNNLLHKQVTAMDPVLKIIMKGSKN